MSKRTRQEKKAEEARIIAEMEAALKENGSAVKTPEKENKPQINVYGEHAPEKIHCKRCKTLMEKGVCPTCGFRIYVPMEKKKQDKVRLIVAAVSMVVFLAIFIAIQISRN